MTSYDGEGYGIAGYVNWEPEPEPERKLRELVDELKAEERTLLHREFMDTLKRPDAINPAHYQGFSNGAQVIDIVENLVYNRGAAVKYLARAGRKAIADELEDLKKAQWYVQREIERIEATR